MSETTLPPITKKFGTFLGVYTPSVLTILGLIMYLRFGWVVGNVGLGLTLLIVVMSCAITLITGLSASAIATNMKVEAGGEYYMISRSLGRELGGAIGIPLYLCRTLSITFYSFGLSEAILPLVPEAYVTAYTLQLMTAAIIVVITFLSGKSADLVLKTQVPLLIIVGLSVIALLIGVLQHGFANGFTSPEMAATYRNVPDGQGFWYVFAIFFPAVTGFAAGIGMSGDLQDPQKSIPIGTIGSILTGLGIYLVIPILLGVTLIMSPQELAFSGADSWIKIAFLGGIIIYPAMWGAMLSSAFGSILGGPRVLQALAIDDLAPKIAAKLSPTGQPTAATWISGALALAAVFLGDLNAVAVLVSVLFLILYVMINLSAALEQLVGDPSYRPTLKVPWYLSLIGAAGTIAVMFLISPIACIVSIVIVAALYFWIHSQAWQQQWGDVRGGFWQVMARNALINLNQQKEDDRNWRPRMLLFTRDIGRQTQLIRYASWFGKDKGFVNICQLIIGDLKQNKIDIERVHQKMEADIAKTDLVAFSEVNVVHDFETGVIHVAQANGIAGLKSNTVMFGWSQEKNPILPAQLRIIRALGRAGKSTIIARFRATDIKLPKKPKIDLWWGGKQENGDLMLLLAYLLTLNDEWQKAQITIRSIVNSKDEEDSMRKSMLPLIPKTRIPAEIGVVVRQKGQDLKEIFSNCSSQADVVFIGLNVPDPGTEEAYAKRLTELSDNFKTTIFVRNATTNSSVPELLRLEHV